MEVHIVTTNNDKYDEISTVLNRYGIQTIHENAELDEIEDNMEDIVKSKAEQAFSIVGKPIVVDDTGMFFEAYDNYPGHQSKRLYQEIGLEGLLEKLKDKNKKAHFKSLICFKDEKETRIFEGKLTGSITELIDNDSRKQFPYDSVFIPDEYSITLSKIPWEDRTKVSHRSEAVKELAKWLIHR